MIQITLNKVVCLAIYLEVRSLKVRFDLIPMRPGAPEERIGLVFPLGERSTMTTLPPGINDSCTCSKMR
jgi:hypothetical protein